MTWRLAKSLETLRAQINDEYPDRSKKSDGTIGDVRHRKTQSEHNPDRNGVVRALDITHDPAHGVISRQIAEAIVKSRDPRILYIISNGEMVRSYSRSGTVPWRWAPYGGSNPHTAHVHFSVVDDPKLYDSTKEWTLGKIVPPLGKAFKGITATVFNDPRVAYSDVKPGYADRPGCAVPYRFPGKRPSFLVTYKGKSVLCPTVDVGPWNINDPWFLVGNRPQAESGVDKNGRKTNKAGIDLTPAAAKAIGLPGKGLVDVEVIL